LELLLPLARAYQVPLDELVGTPAGDDPRVHALPFTQRGVTYQPLTRRPGGLQAYKLIIPAIRPQVDPDPQSHEGYEWLYVLSGSLRLVLGAHDLVLHAGEAAEFDTRVPHWFDAPGETPSSCSACSARRGSGSTSARDRRRIGPWISSNASAVWARQAGEVAYARLGGGRCGRSLTH
jgi:quercetin dioxygenase-like cupin family protein